MIRTKKNRNFWLMIAVIAVVLLVLAGKWLFWPSLKLKVDAIELVKLPSNRLRFPVKVTTSKECDAYIQYWKKGSKDTLYSELSTDKLAHELHLTNTVARTAYRFRVVVNSGKERAYSKIYPLETQAIYQATPYFSLDQPTAPELEPELKGKYFLTQILTEPGSVVIIDHTGEIVWYEPFQKGVKVSHWTKDRTVLCIVGPEKIPSSGGDEILELGLDGKVITHLKKGEGGMDKLVHHEVRKDKDGNIYSLTFTKKVTDLSAVKGKVQDTLNGDGIVVFSPKGKKIWEWSVLDHLDPLKDPEILKHKKDWVHGNSVFRLDDGNFLMSFRDLNQVWKIDFKSGKVLWKLGQGGDFAMDTNALFSAQHYAHPVFGNQLMILDNGERNRVSRAMIFELDNPVGTATAKRIVTLPAEYYTTAKGSAALFGTKQDKVLFCLTDPRAFLITDMNGRILWKIKVGGDPYRLEEINDFEHVKPGI